MHKKVRILELLIERESVGLTFNFGTMNLYCVAGGTRSRLLTSNVSIYQYNYKLMEDTNMQVRVCINIRWYSAGNLVHLIVQTHECIK